MDDGREKTFSFGGCYYQATSPRVESLGPGTKVVNVRVTFEEALKLNLAVAECVRYLNRMKRNTKEGKSSALNLAIYFNMGRVVVTKGKIPDKPRKQGQQSPPSIAEE
jgi:hypothetical protein